MYAWNLYLCNHCITRKVKDFRSCLLYYLCLASCVNHSSALVRVVKTLQVVLAGCPPTKTALVVFSRRAVLGFGAWLNFEATSLQARETPISSASVVAPLQAMTACCRGLDSQRSRRVFSFACRRHPKILLHGEYIFLSFFTWYESHRIV